jgi:LPXTG-motif cell wall-anchored protein
MNQAPISVSAWLASGLGLLLLGAGIIRRRRQLDWFSRLAAAVPGRKWK